MRRILLTVCLAAGICVVVAWATGLLQGSTEKNPTNPKGPKNAPRVDVGPRLYKGEPINIDPYVNPVKEADPITLGDFHFSVIYKVDLASEVDGRLLFYGEEVVGKAAPDKDEKNIFKAKIYVDGRDTYVRYRRLKENDFVRTDQMVALIDPTLALNQVALKRAKWMASKADFDGAVALREVYTKELDRLATLRAKGDRFVSRSEYDIAEAQRDRYIQEAKSKKEAIQVAMNEWIEAQTLLKYYALRNTVEPAEPITTKFKDSIIKTLLRNPGEAVKKGDPIMQLHYIGRLRAEGLVDDQHIHGLNRGTDVEVYPTRRREPVKTLQGHRNAINAVAVSSDGKDPFIISASEDKTAQVWKRNQGSMIIWQHPSAVKSVACTPRDSKKSYCLTGCADGTVRLWDLKHLSSKPLKELDLHTDAINCLAFSPDGKLFAVGSEDGTISLWETESGEKKYSFDSECCHLGAVTALHFTPDLQLVSAGRDNSLRVWTLCENGARLNEGQPISDRSGSVAQLGVSKDGRYMLFDQGKSLQVMSLKDGKTVGVIQDPSASTPFETLAEFSPDGSLVLTANASDGRLQLWRAPTGPARVHEVRQFVPKDSTSPATCAAFGTDTTLTELAKPDNSAQAGSGDAHDTFAVTGTKDGLVHIWAIPSRQAVEKKLMGTISLRDQFVEPSTRQGRLWVEVPNEDGDLLPGETATIVIPRVARKTKK
jgi:WD40 repeat protein